jgi:hypothetical protein
MILVRMIFQGKFGTGGKLAASMVEMPRQMSEGLQAKGRVLSDLSGEFDTVVFESVHESLAAWEKYRAQMFSNPDMEGGDTGEEYIVSGRQEYFTIEADF